MAEFSELHLIAEPTKNEIRDSIVAGIRTLLLDFATDFGEAKREVRQQLASLIDDDILLQRVSGAVFEATERALPKAQMLPFLLEAVRLSWPKYQEAKEIS